MCNAQKLGYKSQYLVDYRQVSLWATTKVMRLSVTNNGVLEPFFFFLISVSATRITSATYQGLCALTASHVDENEGQNLLQSYTAYVRW